MAPIVMTLQYRQVMSAGLPAPQTLGRSGKESTTGLLSRIGRFRSLEWGDRPAGLRYDAPGCDDLGPRAELLRLLVHFIIFAHDPRRRAYEYAGRLLDKREAQRRSGADPDTAPTRMFLPTDLATAAGVSEALHGAVLGFGVVGVSKPTPKRNVFDSPNRSAVLAALIHGATVYGVGSADPSGAAC